MLPFSCLLPHLRSGLSHDFFRSWTSLESALLKGGTPPKIVIGTSQCHAAAIWVALRTVAAMSPLLVIRDEVFRAQRTSGVALQSGRVMLQSIGERRANLLTAFGRWLSDNSLHVETWHSTGSSENPTTIVDIVLLLEADLAQLLSAKCLLIRSSSMSRKGFSILQAALGLDGGHGKEELHYLLLGLRPSDATYRLQTTEEAEHIWRKGRWLLKRARTPRR